MLSKFAGAAEEMPEALLVNPIDATGMAESMHAALTMGLEERRERHGAMLRRLQENTVDTWAKGFLDVLEGRGPADSAPARAAALSVFQPRLVSRSASTSSDSASGDRTGSQAAALSTARSNRAR